MTGSAFLQRLAACLDYLPENDRETVLNYYREKLSYTDTISGEEDLVKSFGAPEQISQKLREAVEKTEQHTAPEVKQEDEDLAAYPEAKADPDRSAPEDEDLTDIPAPEKSELPNGETDVPEDVIFHKPAAEEEGHELIQSLEDHESFNLYGKKVDVKADHDVIQLPEEEDDLTPEELENAKLEALEKASRFDEETFGSDEDASSEETGGRNEEKDVAEPVTPADKEPKEEPIQAIPEVIDPDPVETDPAPDEEESVNAVFYPEEDEEELIVTRVYPGLFSKMFPNADQKTILTIKILFSILFSPVLVLIFGVGIALYASLIAIIVLVSLALFILMLSFIIGGVIELVFGIMQLFTSVSVGLIEIGLGTILFGIVTAVVGLIYEFIFGVVPKAIKGLTNLIKKYLRLLTAVIYGGRV